jgi:hypothetical protein
VLAGVEAGHAGHPVYVMDSPELRGRVKRALADAERARQAAREAGVSLFKVWQLRRQADQVRRQLDGLGAGMRPTYADPSVPEDEAEEPRDQDSHARWAPRAAGGQEAESEKVRKLVRRLGKLNQTTKTTLGAARLARKRTGTRR